MPNLRDAVKDVIESAAQRSAQERLELEHRDEAKGLRFAWAEGIETLFKFKSLAGGGCDQIRDIIENSRLYFSTQNQFNDPLDCSPIFRLGGSLDDPAFIAELKRDEERMIREQTLTAQEESDLREKFGTHVAGMAEEITRQVRTELRNTLHIFCMSSSREHPLLWSHYATSHTGVCLHFKVIPGELTGLARGIDYFDERPPVLVPLRYNTNDGDAARKMSLVKAEFWRYESEYRILANPNVDWGHTMDGRYVAFPPRLLTGITMGMCITPSDRDIILNLAKRRKPELRVCEAYEDPDRFALQFREV